MKLSNKKGFTIVELVVVVAVIAILAAVLIPTVSGIIAKARLNADQQAVANMNKAAAIGAAEDEIAKPGDVVAALYAYGFNEGKLQTYSTGFHYAYDFEKNEFVLLDDGANVVFPKNSEATVANLWGFFNNSKADKIDGVKKYIALSGINNVATFIGEDCIFAPQTEKSYYTLDLAGHYISLIGDEYIAIDNGTAREGHKFTASTAVQVKALGNPDLVSSNAVVEGVLTVKDVVFDKASSPLAPNYNSKGEITSYTAKFVSANNVDVVFKNCTLDYTADGIEALFVGAKSYTFENCVINFGQKNIQIAADVKADVTFKNCEITSGRGINIGRQGISTANTFGAIVFEGNTFVCSDAALNRPLIQFAGASDNKGNGNGLFKADSITIKDNTFNCSDIAIRIHESVLDWQVGSLTLTNNTFGEKATLIDGDGAEYAQSVANSWVFN